MRAQLALIGLALGQVVCHQAILTAPGGSTITLVANPTFIAANGEVSVVSALVIEPAGTPVPDGTVVQFFTDLGRIEEQGKTNDGVARVNLVSDTRSGTANITAASGANNGTATITIGSGRPSRVIVTADPTRIRSNDPRQARIVANVFDDNGNAIRNVPVFFTVNGSPVPGPSPTPTPLTTSTVDAVVARGSADASTELMASGGAPIYTDTNGQAVDFLQTRYPRDQPPKEVTVTALTANGVDGTVDVTIN